MGKIADVHRLRCPRGLRLRPSQNRPKCRSLVLSFVAITPRKLVVALCYYTYCITYSIEHYTRAILILRKIL